METVFHQKMARKGYISKLNTSGKII